ncbi:hypothetical protein M2322_002685 [Rhodoblastus acidophilus]|uniref:hypothetical protein n=1 Tax=Rhodoblastus acidophilus TaxID=1074 RepID=UPI0022253720|nr:hypothetical protein [Rhodoblastus acidophilus]MCW2317131.1 hypothetical protein [Rhodoblastus acidophilus]
MNQQQTKYALDRATAIYKNIRAGLATEYAVPGVRLDLGEKLAALRKGEFIITPPEDTYWRRGWQDYVKFTGERDDAMAPGYEEAVSGAERAYRALNDQIVLGSTSEALALLEAFTKWRP